MGKSEFSVIIENVPVELKEGFVLVNHQCGKLWYWSHYDTYEDAIKNKDNDGVHRIVVSVTGDAGYIKLPEILKDGVYFTRKGSFTTTSWYEISKEEYDRITGLPDWKRELKSACIAGLSDSVRYGYGFSDCGLSMGPEDDEKLKDKYFYTKSIYSSCD